MIIDPTRPAAANMSGEALIKDSDTRQFAADVINESQKVPVIVDFWAPWCGPCKQLTPLLERLVRQAGGRVRMVKINVDENQGLAGQLRIQSVPTVYAFLGGRPIDAFVGAQPESKIRAFIDNLARDANPTLEDVLRQGEEALAEGDAKLAAAIFSEVLSQDPNNTKAIAGMVRALVVRGELAKAKAQLSDLPPEITNHADITAARTAVQLAEESKSVGDLKGLKKRVEANADDHAARFDLAAALFAGGRSDAAIDELLTIITRDRKWNEEAARKQLVKIFEALGPTHPLTIAARRRLSSLLFS